MAWKTLNSTMASAPTLTGQAGSLVALLDAVLVNGFGAQTGLGWSIQYTATNKRVYLAGAACRCRAALRVLDDASLAAGAREAGTTAAESFSDIDTAVNAFTIGAVFRKSSSADGTTRPWHAFGDDRTVILLGLAGDSSFTTTYWGMYFGEFQSFLANDAYQAMHAGRGPNIAGNTEEHFGKSTSSPGVPSTPYNAAIARSHLGTPGLIYAVRLHQNWNLNNFPNAPDGGLYISPVHLSTYVSSQHQIRGKQRGTYIAQHTAATIPFNNGDTVSGVGAMAGKQFVLLTTILGTTLFETSDTVPYS